MYILKMNIMNIGRVISCVRIESRRERMIFFRLNDFIFLVVMFIWVILEKIGIMKILINIVVFVLKIVCWIFF